MENDIEKTNARRRLPWAIVASLLCWAVVAIVCTAHLGGAVGFALGAAGTLLSAGRN